MRQELLFDIVLETLHQCVHAGSRSSRPRPRARPPTYLCGYGCGVDAWLSESAWLQRPIRRGRRGRGRRCARTRCTNRFVSYGMGRVCGRSQSAAKKKRPSTECLVLVCLSVIRSLACGLVAKIADLLLTVARAERLLPHAPTATVSLSLSLALSLALSLSSVAVAERVRWHWREVTERIVCAVRIRRAKGC